MSATAKKITKKVIVAIVGIVLTLGILFGIVMLIGGLISCGMKDDIKSSGYFEYIVVEEVGEDEESKEVAAIVGFTPSGKGQKVIDIPREIDGFPVRYIGYTYRESATSMDDYSLEHYALEKIYIHENIERINRNALSDLGDKKSIEIMICAADPKAMTDTSEAISFDQLGEFGHVYVYGSAYESGDYPENTSPANVVFMNNYSDEVNGGYYSLDNIDADETVPQPADPERSGYEFTGWYTDSECTAEWDFTDTLTIAESDEFVLYAGWRKA